MSGAPNRVRMDRITSLKPRSLEGELKLFRNDSWSYPTVQAYQTECAEHLGRTQVCPRVLNRVREVAVIPIMSDGVRNHLHMKRDAPANLDGKPLEGRRCHWPLRVSLLSKSSKSSFHQTKISLVRTLNIHSGGSRSPFAGELALCVGS